MICEINLLNIIVIQLLHFAISFPQYTIAEGWHPLFLTRVVAVAPQIVLISGHECYHSFLELFEKHVLILVIQVLL